jgi:hypothetical protein
LLLLARRTTVNDKNYMATEAKCPKCGSLKLETGRLHSAYFRPDNTKFFTFDPNVPVRATVCMDCGNIELATDLKRVEGITGDAE